MLADILVEVTAKTTDRTFTYHIPEDMTTLRKGS